MAGGYVGVEGKAKEVGGIYVGVNGKARKVTAAYVGVGGKAQDVWPSERIQCLAVTQAALGSGNPTVDVWTGLGETLGKKQYLSGLTRTAGDHCRFSKNGTYCLIATRIGANYARIFKLVEGVYQALPAQSLGSNYDAVHDMDITSDAKFLAWVGPAGTSLFLFSLDGDEYKPVSLAGAAKPVGATKFSCRFSPDNQYLACGYDVAPYVSLWKREGDTYVRLPDSDFKDAGAPVISFSNRADYLLVGWYVYKREGDQFIKLDTLHTPPSYEPICGAASPNGRHFIVGTTGHPYLYVFERDNDDVVRQATGVLPAAYGAPRRCAFSRDGAYFCSDGWGAPRQIQVFSCKSDVFTEIPGLSVAKGSTILSIALS